MNKKQRAQLRTHRQVQKEWKAEEHQLLNLSAKFQSTGKDYRPMEIYMNDSGMPKCRFVDTVTVDSRR